jgi:hypothetical protein
VLGNVFEIIWWQSRLYDWLLHYMRKFHFKTFIIQLPLTPRYVVVSDPCIIEHVIKTNFHGYIKGPLLYAIFHELLGEGIFATDGYMRLYGYRMIRSLILCTRS